MAERVINIIGLGDGAYSAPDTGENWVLNVAYKKCKKVDKMFFFDDFSIIDKDDKEILPAYNFKDFVADNPNAEVISKYEQQIVDHLDTSKVLATIKPYPIVEAVKLSGGLFFTSTMAYAICYAILEKVDRIRLYGFEVWSGCDSSEYHYQRPCIDFWLAFAMGRGIKVEVPYYLLHTTGTAQNYYGYRDFNLKQNKK